MKRFIALLLTIFISSSVHAAVCHSTPTADDVAFYDRAVVEAATNLTWDGYNANIFARHIIDSRRAALYPLPGIPQSGPLTDQEAVLWDNLVATAVVHAAANTGNANGQGWVDGAQGASWAHSVAWVAMYYRMQMRC